MTTNVDQFLTANQRSDYESIRLKVPIILRSPRTLMSLMLMITDFLSLFLAWLVVGGILLLFSHSFSQELLIEIMPFILLSQGVFALRGLYPAIGISPVNELRRLTGSTTAIFLLLAAMTFWFRNAENYSRINLALTWVFALVMVPLGRALMRELFGRFEFFGEPIVVIGYGERGKETVTYLLDNRAMGLRPIMIIDGCDHTEGRFIGGVPIIHMDDPAEIRMLSKQLRIDTALILASELPQGVLEAAEKICRGAFKYLILIPDREQIGGLGIKKFDLGMYFGLEVKRNLFNTWEKLLKRITDISLVLAGGLLVSPLIFLISILVKLDSKGPVFYGHTRVGMAGRKFKTWKFRTMVPNANQVLNEYLEKNPELLHEWQTTFKLQNDPRVTRVGRVLRKLSLDELPQLWNVLIGEMSLVGPRPIIDDEIGYYGDRYDLYSFVMPGITGLWQVSGRSDTSYEGRVGLDEYYVRNWSIWMDIYIMARTASVILLRKGAY
jgi:Undecaprenyl-phosphate galactose phosphotransferase WbaP